MAIEKLLEKRHATDIPLTVVVDGISMTRHLIQRSDVSEQESVKQGCIDNSDCTDCGYCFCACKYD